jgi:hypothetical protein
MTTKRSNATSLKIFAFSSRPSNLFVLHSEKKKQKKISRLFLSFFFSIPFRHPLLFLRALFYISLPCPCVCVCRVNVPPHQKRQKKKSLSLSGGNGGEEQLIAKR